jgi:Maltokinase N-terminal cap domain
MWCQPGRAARGHHWPRAGGKVATPSLQRCGGTLPIRLSHPLGVTAAGPRSLVSERVTLLLSKQIGAMAPSATYSPAMAILHQATITPTKAELIQKWVPSQTWGPSASDPISVIGSYRFDDPDGRVGLETHLITAGGVLLQIPLTYRDEPLRGAEGVHITQMEHSVLGTRWVYDGLGDPRFVAMLAAVAMSGQGEALSMVQSDGHLYMAPSNVRIHGGGWSEGPVPVDGFELVSDGVDTSVLQNERFELKVFRRPVLGSRPPIGLTASWTGLEGEVVLAEIRER